MSKRIYVGNLSYQTTENDIANLFGQVGEVESANIITDRDTGRSKGFGFVEMGNEDADKAIAQLNGQGGTEGAIAAVMAEAVAAGAVGEAGTDLLPPVLY